MGLLVDKEHALLEDDPAADSAGLCVYSKFPRMRLRDNYRGMQYE
jgi:hypothetical protein